MANAFYTQGLQALGAGKVDLTDDPIYILLIDGADYTPDRAADNDLDDVPLASWVGSPTLLANQTWVGGVFDADNATVAAVAGDQFEYILIYASIGSPAVTYLLYLYDTATGLPCTPNGEDIIVAWSNGANKIFKLASA